MEISLEVFDVRDAEHARAVSSQFASGGTGPFPPVNPDGRWTDG